MAAYLESVGARMMQMALDNLARDGYVAICALAISPTGEGAPILPEIATRDDKEIFAQMLRRLAPHCQAIVMTSEAWTLVDHDPTDGRLTMPLAEHPDKKEGVFVQVSSTCGDYLLTSTFERDKDGRPVRPTQAPVGAWLSKEHPGGIFQHIFEQSAGNRGAQ